MKTIGNRPIFQLTGDVCAECEGKKCDECYENSPVIILGDEYCQECYRVHKGCASKGEKCPNRKRAKAREMEERIQKLEKEVERLRDIIDEMKERS